MNMICAISYSELLNYHASPVTIYCNGMCVRGYVHRQRDDHIHKRGEAGFGMTSHQAIRGQSSLNRESALVSTEDEK